MNCYLLQFPYNPVCLVDLGGPGPFGSNEVDYQEKIWG